MFYTGSLYYYYYIIEKMTVQTKNSVMRVFSVFEKMFRKQKWNHEKEVKSIIHFCNGIRKWLRLIGQRLSHFETKTYFVFCHFLNAKMWGPSVVHLFRYRVKKMFVTKNFFSFVLYSEIRRCLFFPVLFAVFLL